MFELVHIVAQHHLAPLLFCKKEQDKSITRSNRASNPNSKTPQASQTAGASSFLLVIEILESQAAGSFCFRLRFPKELPVLQRESLPRYSLTHFLSATTAVHSIDTASERNRKKKSSQNKVPATDRQTRLTYRGFVSERPVNSASIAHISQLRNDSSIWGKRSSKFSSVTSIPWYLVLHLSLYLSLNESLPISLAPVFPAPFLNNTQKDGDMCKVGEKLRIWVFACVSELRISFLFLSFSVVCVSEFRPVLCFASCDLSSAGRDSRVVNAFATYLVCLILWGTVCWSHC